MKNRCTLCKGSGTLSKTVRYEWKNEEYISIPCPECNPPKTNRHCLEHWPEWCYCPLIVLFLVSCETPEPPFANRWIEALTVNTSVRAELCAIVDGYAVQSEHEREPAACVTLNGGESGTVLRDPLTTDNRTPVDGSEFVVIEL